MSLGFLSIGGTTRHLITLAAASALLFAAASVADATTVPDGLAATDEILSPMTAAEAAASVAALAATTPADIAAAFAASNAEATPTESTSAEIAPSAAETRATRSPRAASLPTLIAAMDDSGAAIAADDELRCLANAVYFESRGEPLEGQLAVAQAILNRVASGRYAGTVCGVINQPRQFSFDRSRAPRAGSDWRTAQAIARIAARDLWHAMAPKALSFHATYVSPNWRGKTRVAQIGRHVFYR